MNYHFVLFMSALRALDCQANKAERERERERDDREVRSTRIDIRCKGSGSGRAANLHPQEVLHNK